MCGICGIINYQSKDSANKDAVLKMCGSLKHRGPDDEGVYSNSLKSFSGRKLGPSVTLGHRRLKIIDLSQAGHQPMSNEDASLWLVFNGEIYNYKELRAQLEKSGHIFKSRTDSEVVLHLYEERGIESVRDLRGMFAFAIWDEKNSSLMLARDRVGKKPLFYCNDGLFTFASELNALLAAGIIKKDLNFEALNHYLTFGYIPAPFTIYKDVLKLPPGHVLVLKDNEATLSKYWSLNYQGKINIQEPDAIDEVLRLIKESVSIRLNSDVELGAFLSGGIDSSAVVALMSEFSLKRVKTFSIGFQEGAYNELNFARNIAKRFGTEHHEFIVRPKALEILPLLVERYGEPYADSSCIPTYYVARETKKYVTVALNGDGGDEVFAGYERYQGMIAAEMYQKIPAIARRLISYLSAVCPASLSPRNRMKNIKRFFAAADMPTQSRYLRWLGIFDETLKDSLYSKDLKTRLDKNSPLDLLSTYLGDTNAGDLLDRLLYADVNIYLPYDLLVKVDITSMANSLEARSPFLDHKLMEFVARLPSKYKINGFIKKHLLKKAISGLIPAENINRRKMGFGVPVGDWLRNELKDFLYFNLLSEKSINRGYFNPEAVKGIIREHTLRKKDYTHQLWALLMLELWHQRFMD